MTIGVDGHVGTVAVKLIGRLHRDDGTRGTRFLAMRIDVAFDPHMNALRVFAAQRRRTLHQSQVGHSLPIMTTPSP